jgi:hypothetical protein
MPKQKHTPTYYLLRSLAILLLMGFLWPSGSAFAQTPPSSPFEKHLPANGARSHISANDENLSALSTTNLIQDPSFESSYGSTYYWSQYSMMYGTPLCILADCGDGGGTARPHSGNVWVWFGGFPYGENATVWQNVNFPKCDSLTLQFYFWIGYAAPKTDQFDQFTVSLDNMYQLFSANALQKSWYPTYTLISIDLSSYEQGLHQIIFNGVTDQLVTFNLDDVALIPGNCTISGNAGVGGATLSYMEGTTQTVLADGSGDYSIHVPFGWSGTVTPSKVGYMFSPANRTYYNLATNQINQDYAAIPLLTISGNTGIADVNLSYTDGILQTVTSQPNGVYTLMVTPGWSGTVAASHPCFTFTPPSINHSNVQNNKITQDYTPSTINPNCVDIDVSVGGTSHGHYGLQDSTATRGSFTNVDNGPAKISSTNGLPILSSERFIYSFQSSKSYAEMMGYPDDQLATDYWFTWYNNVSYSTQLRVSNMGSNSAEVKVYAGSSTTPIDTFTLSAGQGVRKSYMALDNGPLHVVSTDGVTPILASERFIQTFMSSASYSEMMGYPGDQLATEYWFPWYNNLSYSTQLRISNLGGTSAEVKVYAGSSTTPIDTLTIPAGEGVRKSYSVDNGPLHVVSTDGVTPILASERFIQTFGTSASYSEMMGYPGDQLTTEYCFPWYNNTTDGGVTLSSQLRVSNMGATSVDVKVYLAGVEKDSFTLTQGQGARKSYAGLNNGPLCVVSTDGVTSILASERFISTYLNSAAYSEMMGYPSNKLATTYWFPWYNNVSYSTEVRVARP